MPWLIGFDEHIGLTFLCKSNRGLESQNPVLAMVTAGDKSSRVAAAAATYRGFQQRRPEGEEKEAMPPAATLINTAGRHWLEWTERCFGGHV